MYRLLLFTKVDIRAAKGLSAAGVVDRWWRVTDMRSIVQQEQLFLYEWRDVILRVQYVHFVRTKTGANNTATLFRSRIILYIYNN